MTYIKYVTYKNTIWLLCREIILEWNKTQGYIGGYLLGSVTTGDFRCLFYPSLSQFSTTKYSHFHNLEKNNKCSLKRIREGESDWGTLDLRSQKQNEAEELNRRQASQSPASYPRALGLCLCLAVEASQRRQAWEWQDHVWISQSSH